MSTFYFDDTSLSQTQNVTVKDKIVTTFTGLAYPLSVVGTPVNCTVTPSSIASTNTDFTADFSSSTVGSNYSFSLKNGAPDFGGDSEAYNFTNDNTAGYRPFFNQTRYNGTWTRYAGIVTKNTTVDGHSVPFYSQSFSPNAQDGAYNSPLSFSSGAILIGYDPSVLRFSASTEYHSIYVSYGAQRLITQTTVSDPFSLNAGDFITADAYGFLSNHFRMYLLDTVNGTWTSMPGTTNFDPQYAAPTTSTYKIVVFNGTYHARYDTNESDYGYIRKFQGFDSNGIESKSITISGTVSGDPGDIVESTQVQEVGDSIVHLFDITFPAPISQTVHLHNGLDFDGASGQNLYFSTEDGQTLNEYIAFPIAVEGLEIKAGSPGGRPSLAIANLPVLSRVLTNNTDGTEDEQSLDDILTEVGLDSAEGFLYAEIVCRSTLLKYTSRAGDSASLPIEYPKYKFVIDRIAREESGSIVFDLATPADLDNVLLPNRKVVGKYCSWEYQGALFDRGGCTAPGNVFGKFFDEYDQLITADIANSGIPSWSSGTSYSVGTRVRKVLGGVPGYGWRIYDCLVAHSGKNPEDYPFYWKRVDTCGKRIRSCKLRFQGKTSELAADEATLAGTVPDDSYLNENQALPFGGFPGSKKFK